MKEPAISVLMPLYNKEKEVVRAIQSVLIQSFHDFELIIINDGSTDDSVLRVRELDDPRIRLVEQSNQGVSAARNRGIKEAKSELLAFLDADDEWLADFLATIISLSKSYPSAKIYTTSYLMRAVDGTERKSSLRKIPPQFNEGILQNYFIVASHSDPPIWTSATAVDKAAIQQVGGFPVGVQSGEDLLTWARLAAKYQIAITLKPMAIFYLPDGPKSRPSGRLAISDNHVANGLIELHQAARNSEKEAIKRYLANWYRMIAATHLIMNRRRLVLLYTFKAIRLGKINATMLMISFIALIPCRNPGALYRKIRQFWRKMSF